MFNALLQKHPHLSDFIVFGLKQAYASLFGGFLLAAILLTKIFWPENAPITRYDFLFFYAIVIQISFLVLKLETWEEAAVIIIFHIVGTIMEIFKTHVGSWSYPEPSLIHIGAVPLFSGFMYSAVGSYIARAWKIFKQHYTHYPSRALTVVLCVLIYANFFTHHFVADIRILLFAFTAILFWRTQVYFTPHRREYRMPLLLGFFLIAVFIWIAENTSTLCKIWVYPSQKTEWHMVPVEKLGSWFLLMIISFVLVSLIHKEDSRQ